MRLERAGWTVADTDTFLELSDDERRFIETKLALAADLRGRSEQLGLTQSEAARRFGSIQSRVAKMEAADMAVSTDLLLRRAPQDHDRCALVLGRRYVM